LKLKIRGAKMKKGISKNRPKGAEYGRIKSHEKLARKLEDKKRVGQIENAKKNAAAAGVENLIHFAVCDFAATQVPQNKAGVMMVNPEYGERLGDEQELEETYGRIGDFMKKECGGYFGYVFTGNLELAKKIGLKAKRRIEFYNSTIDCRLLEYELYSGTRRVEKVVTPTE